MYEFTWSVAHEHQMVLVVLSVCCW